MVAKTVNPRPKSTRLFNSKFVSPSRRLIVRYDIAAILHQAGRGEDTGLGRH
ncbi:MAG: hypothetical protein Ct9H300mP1_04630 [Planctomycetaceae bacterium]|nr:MAG: hypothetical protein Ct9H300mP1_04630 [Planctomycetaceae bacterium]